MNKNLLDPLFRKKLRQVSNYKEFWICSACGTPRRLGVFHFTVECKKCGNAKPSVLVIQKKRRPWNKECLTRSSRARWLVQTTKDATKTLGIGLKVGDILESVRPKRDTGESFEGWFTKVQLDRDKILQGILGLDVCLK